MQSQASTASTTIVGRYSIHAEIAHGGMATVHVGRLMGPVGFSRTVAIKRLHSIYAKDPEFVAMFMDEARLAARIQHPNVVSIIDVVAENGELLLVMDYVQGESLSRLLRAERSLGGSVDPRIAVKIMSEVLSGLHAAHEARNERGQALGIVHRDVSPQNVLVGADGVGHLIDFGVAKAAGRVQSTRDGQLKGKLAYMAPEQIRGSTVDRRTDIYAAAAVLWEALAGRRLFTGDEANLMYAVLTVPIAPPRTLNPQIPEALDAVVMKGLQKNPAKRFATALEMADALEAALSPASSREVARWMERLAAKELDERASLVAEVESMSHTSVPPPRDTLMSELNSSTNHSVSKSFAQPETALPSSHEVPSAVIPVVPSTPVAPAEAIAPETTEAGPKDSNRVIWIAAAASLALVVGAAAFLVARMVPGRQDQPNPASSVTVPTTPVESALPAASVAPSVAAPVASEPPPASVSQPEATAGARTAKPPAAQPPAPPAATVPPAGAKKKQTYTRD